MISTCLILWSPRRAKSLKVSERRIRDLPPHTHIELLIRTHTYRSTHDRQLKEVGQLHLMPRSLSSRPLRLAVSYRFAVRFRAFPLCILRRCCSDLFSSAILADFDSVSVLCWLLPCFCCQSYDGGVAERVVVLLCRPHSFSFSSPPTTSYLVPLESAGDGLSQAWLESAEKKEQLK